jgi:histidinol dehydrogenase
VRIERFTGGEPETVAAQLHALVAQPGTVRDAVQAIVDDVRDGGDLALAAHAERLDRVTGPLRVGPDELDRAAAELRSDLRAGLEVAMSNVAAVAGASLGDDAELRLPQGQRVVVREVPVGRVAVYAPGGRNPYPSTVVMGAVTAKVAGVEDVVVVSPRAHPVVLAACALCGVDEVWRFGGAHGIAALAYGTASVRRADVIAGPGGPYVQEAKRQVAGDVGIDGYLGPSDVVVVAGPGADPALVATDLVAQAEHGEGTLVVAVSDDVRLLDDVAARIAGFATDAVAALVETARGLEVAEAFAPEHLQLMGQGAEALAPRVRRAGCVFVGASGATAFGDYVAGSNHSLPTGGSARFASALSVRAFRRRIAEVHVDGAGPRLARAGVPIARAEGFEQHARSMEARLNGPGGSERQ